jgi:hypothetical protein
MMKIPMNISDLTYILFLVICCWLAVFYDAGGGGGGKRARVPVAR